MAGKHFGSFTLTKEVNFGLSKRTMLAVVLMIINHARNRISNFLGGWTCKNLEDKKIDYTVEKFTVWNSEAKPSTSSETQLLRLDITLTLQQENIPAQKLNKNRYTAPFNLLLCHVVP